MSCGDIIIYCHFVFTTAFQASLNGSQLYSNYLNEHCKCSRIICHRASCTVEVCIIVNCQESQTFAVAVLNPIWTHCLRSLSSVVCAVLKKPQPDWFTVTVSFQSFSFVVCAVLKNPQPDWFTVTVCFSLSSVVCAVLKKPQPDWFTVTVSFQSFSFVVCAVLKKPQPDWFNVTVSLQSLTSAVCAVLKKPQPDWFTVTVSLQSQQRPCNSYFYQGKKEKGATTKHQRL